jgi:hypothetical protein
MLHDPHPVVPIDQCQKVGFHSQSFPLLMTVPQPVLPHRLVLPNSSEYTAATDWESNELPASTVGFIV